MNKRRAAWQNLGGGCRTGALAGLVALVLGMVVPAFLSRSNLAPLAGILLAGPMVALGTFFVDVARRAKATETYDAVILGGLIANWCAALVYTLFLLLLSPKLSLGASAVQAVGVFATGMIAWTSGRTSPARAVGVILPLACVVLASVFPPVRSLVGDSAGTLAGFTFVLDSHLSGRHTAPTIGVDVPLLLGEWFTFLVVAGAIAGKKRA